MIVKSKNIYKSFLYLTLFTVSNALSMDVHSQSENRSRRPIMLEISLGNQESHGKVLFPLAPSSHQILSCAKKKQWDKVRSLYENEEQDFLVPLDVHRAYLDSLGYNGDYDKMQAFSLNCTALLECGKEFTISNGQRVRFSGSDLTKANEIIKNSIIQDPNVKLPPRVASEYQVIIPFLCDEIDLNDHRMGELISSPEEMIVETDSVLSSQGQVTYQPLPPKIEKIFKEISIKSDFEDGYLGDEYLYLAELFDKGGQEVEVDRKRALDLYEIALSFREIGRMETRTANGQVTYDHIKSRIESIRKEIAKDKVTPQKITLKLKEPISKKRPAETVLEKNEAKRTKPVYVDETKKKLGKALYDEAKSLYQEALQDWTAGDIASAFNGFKKAGELGHADALNSLGLYYLEGIPPCPVDHKEAYEYFKKSAKKGNSKALFNLGYYHDKGIGGIEQSSQKAVEYYTQAADLGHAEAMCNIGVFYENGEGVPQSQKIAVDYYFKAAEKGLAQAQFYLGLCYEGGLALEVNLEKAHYYFQLAANQGYQDAIKALRNY